MEITLAVAMFVVGIIFILKGGDWFVDAAAWLAEVSGIPKVIIGATIVSLATTLPEQLVSFIAALQGKTDMAIGNAVGSVTANLGLILATSAIFAPFAIRRRDYLAKGIIMLLTVVTLLVFSMSGRLSPPGIIILLVLFIVFIIENISSAKRNISPTKSRTPTKRTTLINVGKFLAGTAGIVIGAQLLVDKGSFLAAAIGVPERVIAVTVIAVGTSLPEFVTAITAIVKKQGSLSVGNIIGANIIDNSLILPISTFASGRLLPISAQSLSLDIPVCLLVALVALVPMFIRGKLMRWQGVLLIVIYVAYVTVTVI